MLSKTLPRIRNLAYLNQQGLCWYCGKPMWLNDASRFAKIHGYSVPQAKLLECTAEHLCARSEGGSDSLENIAAACWYCNSKHHRRKRALSPMQFRQHVLARMRQGRWHQLPNPNAYVGPFDS